MTKSQEDVCWFIKRKHLKIDQPGIFRADFSLNLIDKMTIFTGIQYVPFPEYCHFVMADNCILKSGRLYFFV